MKKPAVLLDDIAPVHLALTLGAEKSRVREDDATNAKGAFTRYHGCSHASHRVTQQYRSGEPEPSYESNDVARVIAVAIATKRLARFPVPSGVRHHYVIFSL